MPSFNKRDAQRVGKVVKQFERDQFHPRQTNGLELWNQNQSQNSIPVKIKSCETSGDPVKHSWVRVELDNSGKWTERPEWDKGGPDYSLDEASLYHPDGIAIEPSTIVLAHWSIDQGFLLAESDHVIAYKLQEPMTALNNEADAKAVDGDGNEYGPTIKVVLDPFLYNQFGPALSGWYGYAQYSPNRNSSSGSAPEYNVIYQMRFARYINWQVGSGLEDCQQIATVNGYWDGEQPTQAKVTLSCLNCSCYKGQQCGIAVYDETQSSDTLQVYQIVFIDQSLKMQWNPCSIYAGDGGEPIKNLTVGRGLSFEMEDACNGVLTSEVLKVGGVGCGETGGGGSSSGNLTDILTFESPLLVSYMPDEDEDCPGTTTVKLADGFITGGGDECIALDVSFEDCKYVISAAFNPDCCECSSGSGCSIVESSGCMSVETSTSGGCTYYTINNDAEFVGGEGIEISSSGCVTTISVRGMETGPAQTIDYLCDVDISVTPIEITCIESSGGGTSFLVTGGEITLDKTYGSLVLPQSIIIDSQGCGSGGSGSGGGGDPPPPPPPPEPNGECGIEIGGLDCESNPPGFFFTVDGMPAGATSYSFEVTGNMGSSATVGPSYNHEEEPGTYYGSLNQGWGDVQPGECFTITLSFEGSPCTSTWELCCE